MNGRPPDQNHAKTRKTSCNYYNTYAQFSRLSYLYFIFFAGWSLLWLISHFRGKRDFKAPQPTFNWHSAYTCKNFFMESSPPDRVYDFSHS